jgi:ABC-type multidrug transport system fused ATPase/permease subunit|tara:strand:- start:2295 stop:3050 length:756 start_codon:yes stop_codon:yes gene_type:complete
MAEEDVLLVAVRMDADGAITDTELLDNKFKSLSKTFRNSKEPMVGAEQSQKKLNKAIKEGQKETKDANVANISAMLALEGLTSGLNQSISARYKQIDADLAAGKITAEQAEAKRKEVKQQEFITGSLEQYIAVARLAIATNALLTAARGLDVKATIAQIKANKILAFVMKQNPLVRVLIVVLALAAAFYVLESRLGLLTTTFRLFSMALAEIRDIFMSIVDLIQGFTSGLRVAGDIMTDSPLGKFIDVVGG